MVVLLRIAVSYRPALAGFEAIFMEEGHLSDSHEKDSYCTSKTQLHVQTCLNKFEDTF